MSKKIMLRNVRLSFEHIFTPSKFDENQEAKYSATFIIPKDHPDLALVKKAMFEAGHEAFPSDFPDTSSSPWAQFPTGSGWPRGFSCSLKDADKDVNSSGVILAEKNPEYKGCYVLEANSTRRPVALDRRKAAVTEDDDVIYSGCYVNASLAAKGFTYGKVKKGVKCYLNGVQFVKDGERFGMDASNDFDALDGEDDDFMG